ncbi:MAG: 7-cyano-7-deazaguanine synthase [Patescibacteria group bacterium]|jgi:7-cyano-7-deazaguanine synthase in queuosine biosynthesis
MKQNYKSILLFSGGPDSFIAWHYLHRPPALFINAHQSYAAKELRAVRLLARRNRIELHEDHSFDLSRWEEKNFYIPYRNVFFSMIGSLYAPTVYLVGIKGDRVDDNNPQATKWMSKFYAHFNTHTAVHVTSPFYSMSKSQIVAWYVRRRLPLGDLLATRSCYSKATPGQCGACPSCFRRWVAFENNGIKERYDSPPWEWLGVTGYIRKMKAGAYDRVRTRETLNALKKYRDIG